MARPQPIIIPGNSGMGGSFKETKSPNLLELLQGLNQIAQLYQGTIGASKQKDTDALAVENSLRTLGVGGIEAQTPAGPAMEMPSGGVVNAPTPGGERLDLEALGRSSMGPEIAQKAIMAKLGNMLAPKVAPEWGVTNKTAFRKDDPTIQTPVGPQGEKGSSTNELKGFAEYNFGGDINKAQASLATAEGKKLFSEYTTRPQRAQSRSDVFVGPSLEDPSKDIWSEFDAQGVGKNVLRPSVGAAMPRTLGRTPAVAISQAGYLKHAQDKFARMGEDYRPEYVGWLKNQDIFGLSINEFNKRTAKLPPEQVRFYRNLWDVNDAMIRKSEGAVVPEAMMVRLSKFMNDVKLNPDNFEVQFEDLVNSTRQDMLNLHGSLSSQYKSPFEKRNEEFWMDSKPLLKHGSKNANAGYSSMSDEELLRQLNGK